MSNFYKAITLILIGVGLLTISLKLPNSDKLVWNNTANSLIGAGLLLLNPNELKNQTLKALGGNEDEA